MADRGRIWWRDSMMCWPTLAVVINVLPWHWRAIPRGWYDYSPGGWARDGHPQAGWWGVTGEWLMVKVDFGLNLPPFTLERADADADPTTPSAVRATHQEASDG